MKILKPFCLQKEDKMYLNILPPITSHEIKTTDPGTLLGVTIDYKLSSNVIYETRVPLFDRDMKTQESDERRGEAMSGGFLSPPPPPLPTAFMCEYFLCISSTCYYHPQSRVQT